MRASHFQGLELNWAASATETFSDKNLGMTMDRNFEIFNDVIKEAKSKGIKICFSIAVSFGCPYEGKVKEEKVLKLVEKAVQAGADRIGIADTIGIATPDEVDSLFRKVLDMAGETEVSFHIMIQEAWESRMHILLIWQVYVFLKQQSAVLEDAHLLQDRQGI